MLNITKKLQTNYSWSPKLSSGVADSDVNGRLCLFQDVYLVHMSKAGCVCVPGRLPRARPQ